MVATGSNTAPPPPFNTAGVESHTVPSKPFYAFGAQAVAVEVDDATGKVRVLKVIAAHNVGKAIFRAGIEGQIQGGVAMGLGYALSEEVIFFDGRPLNDSFLDYRLPTMEDVPEIIPVIVEKENARSPEDVRGIGEPSTIPTAAAIANAVYDAVGIRVNHLPLKPERIYWELKKKLNSECENSMLLAPFERRTLRATADRYLVQTQLFLRHPPESPSPFPSPPRGRGEG